MDAGGFIFLAYGISEDCLEEPDLYVRVLFFASTREIIGTNSIEIEMSEGATIRDLRDDLSKQFPGLGSVEKNLAVAINEEYVVDDAPLANGDQVALIPPVSGG